MICGHIIGSNFMIIKLNTKHFVDQHVPLLSCTSLLSPSELPDGFTEPFFRSVLMSLMDRILCSSLATGEAPYPVGHGAACGCFISTYCT